MFSFQLTKNILGIDIGTYSLKIALAQKAGEKVALLNYEVNRFPEPEGPGQTWSRPEIAAFIQHSLKGLGIKTAEVVSEVTGPWTVVRHLFVRDLDAEEMREAIRWGSRSDFPFSLEEAVIDFHKLGARKSEEGVAEAEIISAVATRQAVEEQTALLKQAGLRIAFLSLPPFDLMQAYRITQSPPWRETAAVIELGHKNARIIVLKDGQLKFSREFAVAGEAFTQALVGSYEIDGQMVEVNEFQAERIKIKSGLLEEWEADQAVEGVPQEQIQKRLRPVIDRIILECERSLNYYKTDFKDYEIKRILLTGGGSLLTGLAAALENNLEISVQPLGPAPKLTFKKKINEDLFLKNLPFLAPLLGLITQSRPFIDLSSTYVLPQEKEGSARKYLKPVLAGTVVLGLILGFGIPYWKITGDIARLQKELAAKKAQMAQIGKPAEELTKMEQEEALLNKALEGLPRIEMKKFPSGELFQELSRMVPSNMTLTHFQFAKNLETAPQAESKSPLAKSLQVPGTNLPVPIVGSQEEKKGEYQLVVQGVVFGSDREIIETLSEFTGRLNRSAYFKEAKVQMTLKSNEYLKAAAEFTVLSKIGAGPEQRVERSHRHPA